MVGVAGDLWVFGWLYKNVYTSQGLFKCDSLAIILLQFRSKFDVDFRVWLRYNTHENRERKSQTPEMMQDNEMEVKEE